MKLKFVLIFSIVLGSVFAQESISQKPVSQNPIPEVNQQFGYVSMGVGPLPIPLPVFGLGYRTQKGYYGSDVSLQVTTIVAVTQVKANLLYLRYFKPNLRSQFYMGGGIGPSVLTGTGKTHILISPEFVFGKQYRTESHDLRFFQVQVSFPTVAFYGSHSDLCKFPLVVFSYGIGF